MHIYKPHEHERIGWSPPEPDYQSGRIERALSMFVRFVLLTAAVAGLLAWGVM